MNLNVKRFGGSRQDENTRVKTSHNARFYVTKTPRKWAILEKSSIESRLNCNKSGEVSVV